MNGKKSWFIVDGYRPPVSKGDALDYEGHECYIILNVNDEDAHVKINIYFPDKEPVLGIEYVVPARRVKAFRSNDDEVFKDLDLGICNQYSINITSDIGIIVQYGRLDVNQDNMAYLATMGHGE